ncbi:MAG: acetate--CoA ligase [Bdellovibrionales bacterium]
MSETYAPSKEILDNVGITEQQYESMYKGSIEQPDIFWAVQSKRIDWFKKPTIIKNTNFTGDVAIKWYEDGTLNACYNCVDRHVENAKGDNIALIFEPNQWSAEEPIPFVSSDKDPESDATFKSNASQTITYKQLQHEVSKLANAYKELGVKKGDRIIIYMPMILEAVFAMLACARIGAIHSVVFAGFSSQSLHDRIIDCDAKLIITADAASRGNKPIPLITTVNEAIKNTNIESAIIVEYEAIMHGIDYDLTGPVNFHYYHQIMANQSPDCPCEEMNAEDPLFILYTSGSTGKPKGVLHTTGGYMVYASLTHEVSFDHKTDDIYWCTADVGWVTGHSYIVYGPLANGATSLVFEGVPNFPDWSRLWRVIDKHNVNIFYTAPTAIRALLREGNEHVAKTSRKSLRILGTVGEPINVEAWEWYYNIVGEKRCPVIDTWWQTETGGHMITPLPCHTLKPGHAQKPFFGVRPAIVDNDGKILEETNGELSEGNFVILESWPGQMRSIYGDHKRFIETYFSTFPGMYFTGDGAKRDTDGDYRITGRVDDVINVSGHRLGTAEIESAINEHVHVAESAVVGYPHDIKGTGIYAYVTLNAGCEANDDIKAEVIKTVRTEIGPIATPDLIQWATGLPKTRSGKIMRRILRKIAANEEDSIGDTSTLADPSVVDDLVRNRK